jgi:hypothetical protein
MARARTIMLTTALILPWLVILKRRIIVDEHGIVMAGLLLRRRLVVWNALRSWKISIVSRATEAEDFICRKVHFYVAGRLFAVRIWEGEVSHPGFDAFVRDIRRHAGPKEAA